MAAPVKDLSTRRPEAWGNRPRAQEMLGGDDHLIAHGSAIDDHVWRPLYQLGQSMQVRVLGMDKGPTGDTPATAVEQCKQIQSAGVNWRGSPATKIIYRRSGRRWLRGRDRWLARCLRGIE